MCNEQSDFDKLFEEMQKVITVENELLAQNEQFQFKLNELRTMDTFIERQRRVMTEQSGNVYTELASFMNL